LEQEVLVKKALELKGVDHDETAVNILKYVIEKFKYRSDIGEVWTNATSTFSRRYGDCEDLNTLVYVLCRFAGIPSYLLYVGLVDTNYDEDSLIDHYMVFYWSSGRNRKDKKDKLVVLDATYYPETSSIEDREEFSLHRGVDKIHYLFNEERCYNVNM